MLWFTFTTFVSGVGSPTNLVQHSPALSNLFAKHVTALEACAVRGSRIRKMKFVKPRFNSTAVPLQRSVLFFEAVWCFCIDVIATRPGQEPAKHAASFLTTVTAEGLLQAAMMADAADEHMLVRRFFDTPEWDPMAVGVELDQFIRKLEHLFVAQPGQEMAAGCMSQGFVRHACLVLSKPHVCWIRGVMHVVGGPGAVTVAVVGKCLSRMANWLRLTISAVSAEFPQWQLLRSLDVFNLVRHTVKKASLQPVEQSHLKRLATAFKLDEHVFREEFDACLHVAKNAFLRDGSGNNVTAWVSAVKMLYRGRIGCFKTSPLARVLQIAVCWTGLSTSKIEQSFGKIKSACSGETRHMADETESLEARVVCDLKGAPADFKAKVFEEATLIWSTLWPRQRASGTARLGNFSRKRKPNDNSEQGFLKKRRRVVQAATSVASPRTIGDVYNAAVSAGSSTWGDSLADREAKLKEKADASKYTGEHWMLKGEQVEAHVLHAEKARAKAHAAAERAQAKQRSLKSVFKHKKLPLEGMVVHLCDGLDKAICLFKLLNPIRRFVLHHPMIFVCYGGDHIPLPESHLGLQNESREEANRSCIFCVQQSCVPAAIHKAGRMHDGWRAGYSRVANHWWPPWSCNVGCIGCSASQTEHLAVCGLRKGTP